MVGTIKRIIERNRFECELAAEQRDKGGRWSFSKLTRTFQSRNVVSRSNYLLVVNYVSKTSYLSLNRGRACPRRCLSILWFLITSRCSSPTFPRPVIVNFPLQTIFVSILSLYRLIWCSTDGSDDHSMFNRWQLRIGKLPRFVNKVSKLLWNWIISPWNTVLRRRWFDVEKLPIEKSSYKTRSFTDDSYFVSEATSFCEYDWKRVNLRWGLFLEKCYNQLSMLLE